MKYVFGKRQLPTNPPDAHNAKYQQ